MVCAYTASIVNLKETRKQVINYLAQLMTPSRSVSPSWCARKRGIIVPAHPETNPCSFYAIFFLTMVLVQKRCVLHGVGELIVCIRWLRTCIFRKKKWWFGEKKSDAPPSVSACLYRMRWRKKEKKVDDEYCVELVSCTCSSTSTS